MMKEEVSASEKASALQTCSDSREAEIQTKMILDYGDGVHGMNQGSCCYDL